MNPASKRNLVRMTKQNSRDMLRVGLRVKTKSEKKVTRIWKTTVKGMKQRVALHQKRKQGRGQMRMQGKRGVETS